MIRSFSISVRASAIALLLPALTPAPGRSQNAAPGPPIVTSVSSSRPPKDWYPRLTGVPVLSTGPNTFVLAGTSYQKRLLLVTFFADAPPARVSMDLALFPTDGVQPSSDGASDYVTLRSENDLFPAVDALNDRPEVRGAALVPDTTPGPVAPTPLFGAGSDTAAPAPASPQESLWPGDVNGDFHVDLTDAILVLKAAVGLVDLTPLENARADVERKGTIDIGDAVLTLGLAVGLGLPPPYGYPG